MLMAAGVCDIAILAFYDGFLAAPAAANVRRLQLGYWHKVGLVTLPLGFS
jgi:hypothetical protein